MYEFKVLMGFESFAHIVDTDILSPQNLEIYSYMYIHIYPHTLLDLRKFYKFICCQIPGILSFLFYFKYYGT